MRSRNFQRHLARRLVIAAEPRMAHRTTYPEERDDLVYVELPDGSAYWIAFQEDNGAGYPGDSDAPTRARVLEERVREITREIKRAVLPHRQPAKGRGSAQRVRSPADNDLSDHQAGEI